MAHHVEFDAANRVLRCRLEGDVEDESIIDCYQNAVLFAYLTNPRAGIADFSDATSVDVSTQTVRELAHREPTIPGSRPRVLVAPTTRVYGLAQMFQQYGKTERPGLHVVRSVDEAYAFLGVRAPHFQSVKEVVPTRHHGDTRRSWWPRLRQQTQPPKPFLVAVMNPEDEATGLLDTIYNLATLIQQARDLGKIYEYITELNEIRTKLAGPRKSG